MKKAAAIFPLGLLLFLAERIYASEKVVTHSSGSIPEGAARDYIKKYSSLSQDTEKYYSVPALFTLAQGGLESAWGTSNLVKQANNHFGIKAGGSWPGPSYNGFRKYQDASGSYFDHGKFLTVNDRYHAAFNTKDPVQFAQAIAAAGYSESSNYSDLISSAINSVRTILGS